MSGEAFKPLAATGLLTNAAATYYTVPAKPDNTITHVRGVILCNTDTSARTVRLHNVVSGGSAAASNAILYDMNIAANSSVFLCLGDGALVMAAGGTLQALASTTNVVTLTVSGEEVVP